MTVRSLIICSLLFPLLSGAQQLDKFQKIPFHYEILLNEYAGVDAVIVQLGSDIMVEKYFNGFAADSLRDTRSAFKSITSLLVGIAIDQKLFTLADTLGTFFPELENEQKRGIQIQHLLEMRSGLECEEFYGLGPDCEDKMWSTEDWIDFCLHVNMVRESGKKWSYNSIDPMIVGEVITRTSGMTVMEFARQFLFQPLEIVDYRWTTSPKGQGMTGGSFYMKPLDMLKIISLVKQKGNWDGDQLISAEWIEQSTTCDIPIDYSFVQNSKLPQDSSENARYGLYWYREKVRYGKIDTEVLFASGNGGQYMMWLPEYDLSVVFSGSNYGNWRGKLPFSILLTHILPAVQKNRQD